MIDIILKAVAVFFAIFFTTCIALLVFALCKISSDSNYKDALEEMENEDEQA